MKALQTMTSREDFNRTASVKAENLPNGGLLAKTVATVKPRKCCGAAFKEQVE